MVANTWIQKYGTALRRSRSRFQYALGGMGFHVDEQGESRFVVVDADLCIANRTASQTLFIAENIQSGIVSIVKVVVGKRVVVAVDAESGYSFAFSILEVEVEIPAREIAEPYDALSAIESVLPAGTLSGAPKIRAAEIINELEDCRRGIYGGAVGYISLTGNMDMCIAIRLAYKKDGKVYIRSGAGIVADSVPETEFQESLNKAKAVLVSMQMAEEEDL